jgi:hypothetical protein
MTTRIETSRILRLGARAAYATGVVAPIGLASLIAMYVAFAIGSMSRGLVFGWINDVLAIVTGLLMLPVAVAVHVLLRSGAPQLSRLLLLIGIGANVAIVVLQSLLVLGALTFAQEIGPVLVAFLFLAVWFVMTGYLGSRSGVLSRGFRMGLLAVTYVGYPIWAFWLGRHLLQLVGEPVSGPPAGAERQLATNDDWRS